MSALSALGAPAQSTAVVTPPKTGGSALEALGSGVTQSASPTPQVPAAATRTVTMGRNQFVVPTDATDLQVANTIKFSNLFTGPTQGQIVYDLTKHIPTPTNPLPRNVPDFLGGGSYTATGPNGGVVDSGHGSYGGEEAVKGSQRDDKVPVALGGLNADKSNIQLQSGYKSGGIADQSDKLELKTINDYKAGKLTLGAARTQILSQKQHLQNDGSALETAVSVNNDVLNKIASVPGAAFNVVSKGAQTIEKSAQVPARMIVNKESIGQAYKNSQTIGQQVAALTGPLSKNAETKLINQGGNGSFGLKLAAGLPDFTQHLVDDIVIPALITAKFGSEISTNTFDRTITPEELKVAATDPKTPPVYRQAFNDLADNGSSLKVFQQKPAGTIRVAVGKILGGTPKDYTNIEVLGGKGPQEILDTGMTPDQLVPKGLQTGYEGQLSRFGKAQDISTPDNINTSEISFPKPTETPGIVQSVANPLVAANINQQNKVNVPKAPQDTSIKMTSGFDPGVDKFIAEDVKPAAQASVAAAKSTLGFVKNIGNSIVNVFDQGAHVEKTLGGKAYSDAIKAIHTPDAEAVTFDNNFQEAQKYFDKFSNKDLQNFNLTRGETDSAEAQSLQRDAQANLPKELAHPEVTKMIRQASDYVLNLGRDNGLDIKELEDYFYGTYKASKGKVSSFLDHWKSTERYIKHKVFPTPADAAAYGLELKHQNPITNIKAELVAVAKRVGLKQLRGQIENSEFAVTNDKATAEQKQNWIGIKDPVFNGLLVHPSYAKLVNNLISTNKISQGRILSIVRSMNRIASIIKFYGSIFHQTNMLKASIADAKGGPINPKGLANFGKGFKSIDKTAPEYKEYVRLGGGHQYSLESEAQTHLRSSIDRIMRGNYLGGLVRAGLSLTTEFGGYTNWLFDKFIPSVKYNAYQFKLAEQEAKTGKPLSDADKISIIRENQNIYGEMNERLFGRSGTVTSAMRLLFTAPGYAEGNFRMAANAVAGKGWKGKARAASFIAKSLLVSLITAIVGTRLITGKWPTKPKTSNQIRDLFKIQTNAKDGNGDPVMVDMMTYDKDYWSIFGNVATRQPGKIGSELSTRTAGLFSIAAKIMTDTATVLEGKTVVDYKDTPIYNKTDTFQTKISKFWTYELTGAIPISVGAYVQSRQKGNSVLASIVQAITGLKPTTSEGVKDVKAARADWYSMQTDKKNKQIELNKLYQTNPKEAIKQAKEFNASQMEKVKDIMKVTGNTQTSISRKDWDSIGIININPKGKDTSQGTTAKSFLSP